MLLRHFGRPPEGEELIVNPPEEVVESLRCGNDVEGRRNSSTVFEVRYPQLATSEFPLCVGLLLEQNKSKDFWKGFPNLQEI